MTTGTEPTLTNSNDGGTATTPSSAVSASSHGKAGASDAGISREPVVRPTDSNHEPRCEYCGWKLDAAHASGCPVESAEMDDSPVKDSDEEADQW